jgi:hypothetical protein
MLMGAVAVECSSNTYLSSNLGTIKIVVSKSGLLKFQAGAGLGPKSAEVSSNTSLILQMETSHP